MQQSTVTVDTTATAISRYFNQLQHPSQQETLGQIVLEILNDGRHLNRKAICTKLLSRLDNVSDPKQEGHYHTLIGMLFTR